MKVFLNYVVVALTVTVATARIATSKVQEAVPVKVVFPCGAEARLGNELTPTQVKDSPKVYYLSHRKSYFSVVFLGRIHGDQEVLTPNSQTNGILRASDIDQSLADRILADPENCPVEDTIFREYLQWLVVNIPGDLLSKGEELAQYISSAPPKGSGLHRYTFLVYKQPGKIEFNEKKLNNTSVGGRDYFCVNRWAAKHCLGDPIGGNYYYAQYDRYVPEVYKQIGAEYLNKEYVRPTGVIRSN